MRVTDLRCEYRVDPLGLDVARPRLSWRIESPDAAAAQTAFEVRVAGSPDTLADGGLWRSGRVESSECNQIEYAGMPLRSRRRCHWQVRVWDDDGTCSGWSTPARWSTGLLAPDDWQAQWIGLDAPAAPQYLRRPFHLTAPVLRATLYASALGLYEMRLGGSRVGDALLSPEWTNYHRRVQYQTNDVTDLVQPGENVLGAILGNGWYCGDWQFWDSLLRPIYGTRPFLRAQLEVELLDGRRQTVTTDAEWRGTDEGPLRFAGLYEGENYDARRAMPGWDRAGFDPAGWLPVPIGQPKVGRMVWQRCEPIRVQAEIMPCSVSEPRPGVHVFDLGQNIAGRCRLRANEPAGTVLTLRHNEMLNPDGTVYMDNLHAGKLSTGDRQIVRYTCGDGTATYEPHFTYQGFRYVEVHGLSRRPGPDFLTGRVFHTDLRPAGEFACSNPLLNRLAENIRWSQRANIMGVPTDCCQRDERCGYTGDMNFFAPTALYQFDMAAFFNKWLVDLCADSQLPNGHFADHAPYYGPGGDWNVGWADAGIICPWLVYRAYGDIRIIRDHYEAMERYMALQIASARHGLRGPDRVGLGDWLNLGGGASKTVIGTAYYAYTLRLMSEMSAAVGKDAARYAALAGEARDAFGHQLIDDEGRIAESSQTGYALAFSMGLVPPGKRDAARARFAEEMRRFDDHLATGFIGTPHLLPGLHAAGLDDLAYRVLLNESYPSWLYPVTLGATTIWERWDGWRPAQGFSDPAMNSFNHYAFGSVGEYLYGVIGGIRAGAPGYASIDLSPTPGPGLDWARAVYRSIRGEIVSEWHVDGDELTVEARIPVNTTATIRVPATNAADVRVVAGGGGLNSSETRDGAALFQAGAGKYLFSVRR